MTFRIRNDNFSPFNTSVQTDMTSLDRVYNMLFLKSLFAPPLNPSVSEPQPSCCGDWEHGHPPGAQLCGDLPDWRRDWTHHPRGCAEEGPRPCTLCALGELGGGEKFHSQILYSQILIFLTFTILGTVFYMCCKCLDPTVHNVWNQHHVM